MAFVIELAGETIDRDKPSTELIRSFQEACRLRIYNIELMPKSTIPEEYQTIADERKHHGYTGGQ